MWRNFEMWRYFRRGEFQMWRHFECREILNVDLFCCHLRCFVAKPVLSRLTHFLCGDKLSQIVCPWRKMTNTMYEEEHCFISLLALYELFYSFSLLSAHMVNRLNPQSKCSTHINIYLHMCVNPQSVKDICYILLCKVKTSKVIKLSVSGSCKEPLKSYTFQHFLQCLIFWCNVCGNIVQNQGIHQYPTPHQTNKKSTKFYWVEKICQGQIS